MPLLILGDSISAGVGASRHDLGYAALLHRNCPVSWPAYTGRDLETVLGGNFPALSLARSGATSSDTHAILERALGRLATPQAGPGVAVMTVGGNDLKNGLFSAGMAGLRGGGELRTALRQLTDRVLPRSLESLRNIVARLRTLPYFAHEVSIFMGNVYDPSDGIESVATPWGTMHVAGVGDVMHAWHAAYDYIARELGVTRIDLRTAFTGHGLSARGDALWLSDWIHPNDRGHHEIRHLFLEAIHRSRR